jgi:hypothetical protein
MLPASILLIVALVSACKWIAGGAYAIFVLSGGQPEFARYGYIDLSLGIANLALCYGAVLLLQRRSLSAAWITAITATIPCISPCIIVGIPIGICLMILLRRPDVQAAFVEKKLSDPFQGRAEV